MSIGFVKRFLVAGFVRGAGAISLLALFSLANYAFSQSAAAFLIVLVTLSAIITPIALVGFNTLAVRALSSTTRSSSHVIFVRTLARRVLLFLGAATLLAVAVAIGFAPFGIGPRAAVALVLLAPVANIAGCCLQGLGKFNQAIVFMNVSTNLLLGLFVGICVLTGVRELAHGAIELMFFVACLISAVLGVGAVARKLMGPGIEEGPDIAKVERREVFLYWVIYVLVALINFLPQMVFYQIGDQEKFLSLATAQKVANVINFVLIVSNFLIAPRISFLYNSGSLIELRRLYIGAALATTAVAAVPTLLCLVFPSYIMQYLGAYSPDAGIILTIFCLAQFFNVATGSSSAMLTMTGKAWQLCLAMSIAFLFTIGCIILLGPEMGAVGFAFSTAIGLAVQNVISVFCTLKLLRPVGSDR